MAGVSLCMVALPLAWSWLFPLRSWFTNNWAMAGKFPGAGLGELATGASLLALGLSAALLLRAMTRRRAEAWASLTLLLAPLASLSGLYPAPCSK